MGERMSFMTLAPYEAFYLFNDLNIIKINQENIEKTESLAVLKIFVSLYPNFVREYVAYKYFKFNGWTVRSGMRYASQFGTFSLIKCYMKGLSMTIIQSIS
ncbi:hypothetical protein RF11_11601 [Thelohanellus kitauei]|uniref:Uncharacterized protein n=1 Tax=Thelohanellus kitauei TaxID=669202 RepID=A0A0C2JSN3_THEKT|nr:hypothetical protein RF11_11601 [Thelohanellus kitauei]